MDWTLIAAVVRAYFQRDIMSTQSRAQAAPLGRPSARGGVCRTERPVNSSSRPSLARPRWLRHIPFGFDAVRWPPNTPIDNDVDDSAVQRNLIGVIIVSVCTCVLLLHVVGGIMRKHIINNKRRWWPWQLPDGILSLVLLLMTPVFALSSLMGNAELIILGCLE